MFIISPELLSMAHEAIDDAIAVYDARDRLVALNDRYVRLRSAIGGDVELGVSWDDLVTASVRAGTIREAVGREQEWLAYRRAARGAYSIIRQIPDGTMYYVTERRMRDGGIVCVWSDVTIVAQHDPNSRFRPQWDAADTDDRPRFGSDNARRSSDPYLRPAETPQPDPGAGSRRVALLRSVGDIATDSVIVIDAAGLIQSVSVAAEHMFAFRSAELLDRNFSCLMPPSFLPWRDSDLARYIATGEPGVVGTGCAVVGQRSDGTTFPMELAIEDLNIAEERLFTCVIRDLSRVHRTVHRVDEVHTDLTDAARLNQLRNSVAELAHAMAEPLTAILNYVSGANILLVAGDRLGASQALRPIAMEADRVREIIRQLRGLTTNRTTV